MSKQYIPLFLDFNDTTQDLTDEECGRLVRAIVEYAKGNDCETRLCGAEKIAFRFLKGVIDRNQAISDVRRQARCGKTQQAITNDNKTEQTISKSPKEKDKEKDKDKDKKDIALKRFTPPTVDDVRAYCRERGNSVDPEKFVDFYTAKGWRVGNQAMKDWKAAVRTWERNRTTGGTLPAQDYHQRDYSKAQDDAFERMMNLADL